MLISPDQIFLTEFKQNLLALMEWSLDAYTRKGDQKYLDAYHHYETTLKSL